MLLMIIIMPFYANDIIVEVGFGLVQFMLLTKYYLCSFAMFVRSNFMLKD